MKIFETIGSMLTSLYLVLSNRSSFLNIGVISAIFSTFGNLFCFRHSLMQFARSLQICLFASFTILVRLAPLVFLVASSEFMILEMSSLFTKLKLNNCVVPTDDLTLIILGWFSHLRIVFSSGSSDYLFEIHHLLRPLVMSLK